MSRHHFITPLRATEQATGCTGDMEWSRGETCHLGWAREGRGEREKQEVPGEGGEDHVWKGS